MPSVTIIPKSELTLFRGGRDVRRPFEDVPKLPEETYPLRHRLAYARWEKELTCKVLGGRAGYSHTQVSSVENGTATPTAKFLYAVAGPLGIDPGELLSMIGAKAVMPRMIPPSAQTYETELIDLLQRGPFPADAVRAIHTLAKPYL